MDLISQTTKQVSTLQSGALYIKQAKKWQLLSSIETIMYKANVSLEQHHGDKGASNKTHFLIERRARTTPSTTMLRHDMALCQEQDVLDGSPVPGALHKGHCLRSTVPGL